ncbi:hypothetical protein [Asanoa iriomotensis]|uniref:Uncharacterized protein n=1 Tax=Asanoa iriomotensis TaxID=234613 RepID=A0ABQ4C744_9ACTN|nr:hypothetical protein [Asanoa iriomotensis]GIF58597.1 hypothetical protein Air01nite_46920 [Asanoa iriomotensis]
MVKPPARPLIRCAQVHLAAAAFLIGGVVLPGVALPGIALAARTAAAPAELPVVPGSTPRIAGLPDVESLLPPATSLLPSPAWRYLDPLRPIAVPGLPAPGLVVEPVDPGGWFDHEDPDEPAPDDPRPDDPVVEEPAPDQPVPGGAAPPVPPVAPAAPVLPTVAPAPPPGVAPQQQPRPASPSSSTRHRRTPTPSPADTRGLDELFPDRPSTDPTAGAGGPGGGPVDAEPASYARPLIYSGIAGLLVSAIGIAVVLNRRRGW